MVMLVLEETVLVVDGSHWKYINLDVLTLGGRIYKS